jgi:hypothetical protein
MKKTNVLRGLLSVGMLAGAVAWTAGDASASEHLLAVHGYPNLNNNCPNSAPDGNYWFEAWGFDGNGNIVCEAGDISTANALALTDCSEKNPLFPPWHVPAAVTQASVLTVRNSAGSYVRTVVEAGKVNWGVLNQGVTYTVPGYNCTYTVYSEGLDTST